jgi:hypothetical protein
VPVRGPHPPAVADPRCTPNRHHRHTLHVSGSSPSRAGSSAIVSSGLGLEATPERKGGPRDKGGEGGALVRHGQTLADATAGGAKPRRPPPSAVHAFHVKRPPPYGGSHAGAGALPDGGGGRPTTRPRYTVPGRDRCQTGSRTPALGRGRSSSRRRGTPTRRWSSPGSESRSSSAAPAGRGPGRVSARSWRVAPTTSLARCVALRGAPVQWLCHARSPAPASITVERPAGTRHAPRAP